MTERMAYFIVLSGGILWGTTGTAQTFIPETVDPFVVAMMRVAIGGFVLLLGLLFLKRLNFSRWPWKTLLLLAFVLALFQYFFFASVRLTGVAVGTVVSIGSAPIFSGLMEWVFLGQVPKRQWVVATAMAIIGSALLFFNKDLVMLDSTGLMFAFIAGFLFASYTFFNKRVLVVLDAIESVAVVFVLSALLLLPLSSQFSFKGLMTVQALIAIIYIGLVTTALGYILFSTGLKYIPSSSAMTLSLVEPFTAAILSVVVVGEYLNASAWTGVCLLMAGIVILTIGSRKRAEASK